MAPLLGRIVFFWAQKQPENVVCAPTTLRLGHSAALPDRYRVRGRLGYPIRGQTGVFEPGCSLSRQPAYVESPTRSGERPTYTSLHNARPHTYLNRGWPRSNAAQKSVLRGVTPPQTGRLRQELQRRKWRDFATSADYHQRRAAARHAAITWSGWRGARPIVEALQSCKRTAYPRSGKRVRNAEIATSPARTRLPVPRRRPARLPLLALGCVGHSTTSALAKPAHTRRAWRLGTRQNHRRWLVGGEGRSG